MRYYDISISKNGQPVIPWWAQKLNLGSSSYTSYVNGQTLPGALDIELNVPVAPYATPQGSAKLVIWGVSIQEVSQAFNLGLCDITIKAGMQKGLPLANPKLNVAPLVQGTIFQPFGNWEGNIMTLEMQLLPPVGVTGNQKPIVFQCKKGQQIGAAIQQALQVAFPLYTIPTPSVSSTLVAQADLTSRHDKLSQFSSAMKKLSLLPVYSGATTLTGAKYTGINVIIIGKTIVVYDGSSAFGGTSPNNPTSVAFQDLVGQPTWLTPTTLNFKTVMRTDINVGDYIKLPATLGSPYVVTTPASASPSPMTPSRNNLTFSGTFQVVRMQHFGRFRALDGGAWVTSFDAVFTSAATGGTAP